MNKARKEQINIDMDLNLNKQVNILPLDLSIILGNILDNAIEACMKLTPDSRTLKLNIYEKGEYLIIKATNSKAEEYTESNTTKEDKSNHGFGLLNIKQTVKKLNGIIKLED